MINRSFWKNKKVIITGHTGFKGMWLSLILKKLGCRLYGFSLKPSRDDCFYKIFKKKIFLSMKNLEIYQKIIVLINLKILNMI